MLDVATVATPTESVPQMAKMVRRRIRFMRSPLRMRNRNTITFLWSNLDVVEFLKYFKSTGKYECVVYAVVYMGIYYYK